MRVLRDLEEIKQARAKLVLDNLSSVDGKVARWLYRVGLRKEMPIGDSLKSWDVLQTLQFFKDKIARDLPVLDLGCYCSEVPVSLSKMGYQDIWGVDLNPQILNMPSSNTLRYKVGNFYDVPFPDGAFHVITAISVIEHGLNLKQLLREVSRLLDRGGYFIASFDYWPDKIETSGVKFFGLDWTIFSKQEVLELLSEAAEVGLFPLEPFNYMASERPIQCGGKSYTFAWLALKKDNGGAKWQKH